MVVILTPIVLMVVGIPGYSLKSESPFPKSIILDIHSSVLGGCKSQVTYQKHAKSHDQTDSNEGNRTTELYTPSHEIVA